MAELVTLSFKTDCGGLSATIAPAAGGSVASFSGERDGRVVDWLRPASPNAIAAGNALGMASFPLVPFCSRIRAGRFAFDGADIVLAPNFGDSPHTLHGTGWQRRWEAVADTRTARLRYEHRPDQWPFAFEAKQVFALDEQGLRVEMAVTNTGSRPMPVGLGHHPYYPYVPGTAITAHTDAIWLADDAVMPVSLTPGHPVVRDLAQGMAVRAHELDNNFTGWNRRATIDWPGGGPMRRSITWCCTRPRARISSASSRSAIAPTGSTCVRRTPSTRSAAPSSHPARRWPRAAAGPHRGRPEAAFTPTNGATDGY